MIVEEKKVITLDYTVKNDSGDVIDSSEEGEKLTYLHGARNIIPGLEAALAGKKVGETFDVTVAPADAYGERRDELVQLVPVSAFEGVEKVEAGMSFNAEGPQGPVTVMVVGVEGDDVTIDANHPLAGMSLSFEGTVRDIREASEEEVSHGHVH